MIKKVQKKKEAKIKDIHSMIQPNGVGGRNNNEKCESMLTHIYIKGGEKYYHLTWIRVGKIWILRQWGN